MKRERPSAPARFALSALTVAIAGLSPAAGADDDAPALLLERVTVVGNPAEIEKIPGSAQVVTQEQIRQQNYDDINRVLRQVPGVYVREEDGFGLFPNISLRGADTTRSAKVTVMEDGIMMAPAPYSAPAAYYTPTAGRMSGVEILKGSSQIEYGPHTTGGVINYLSTPVPTREKAYLKATLGSFGEQRTHAYYGNSYQTGAGTIGLLVESYRRESDGFKHIDQTPDFRDGDQTGFDKEDQIVKLVWEPDTELYQRIELKLGRTTLDADETYLGLTEEDFRADPNRRYAASRFDNMKSEQTQASLRWAISPSDDLDIVTTAYRTGFERNWYKLNKVDGQSLSTVLATPGAAQECMKGNAACDLRVKANNREYGARGIETVGYFRFEGLGADHEIEAGLRLHEDWVRRYQWEDTYSQAANGAITAMTPGIPGDAGDRYQKSRATALFVQDTIEKGRWTLVPGLRYEWIEQRSEDPKGTLQGTSATSGRDGENRYSVSAWGLGLAYRIDERLSAFGGLHSGYSVPSPRGTRAGLDPETSTAFEAGLRLADAPRALAAEATLFYTAFDDLIVIDNVGGTGTGNDENFGQVDVWGLELSAQHDAGLARGWSLSTPAFVSLTYTSAEQKNDSRSTDAESIFSFGRAGNQVPYVPELTVSAGIGVESARWGLFANANYVSETYTSASNVDQQLNGDGDPDARYGKTDAYTTVDLAAHYRMKEGVKLFAGVQNLFDESYLVSRQPHGPRGGMPRFVYAGIEMEM